MTRILWELGLSIFWDKSHLFDKPSIIYWKHFHNSSQSKKNYENQVSCNKYRLDCFILFENGYAVVQ